MNSDLMAGRFGMPSLLPAEVVAVEAGHDVPESTMYAAEAAEVSRAVAKRRAEFATVRDCARRALAALGKPPVAILPGEKREPLWPNGIVGSMTHCSGYRAAALARDSTVASVGIDAELNLPLPEGVTDVVTIAGERPMLAQLAKQSGDVAWDRLLFSAKEAVYKSWFPLTRRWLDFSECELVIEPDGRFTGTLLVPGPVVDGAAISQFDGRWKSAHGVLLTAICVHRTMPERST